MLHQKPEGHLRAVSDPQVDAVITPALSVPILTRP